MKKITSSLLALLLFLVLSCDREDGPQMDEPALKQVVIGDYRFEVPRQFELIERQGIDSYVGMLSGMSIEIDFDFGIYTLPYEDLPASRFEVIQETFDSVERQIIIARNPTSDFTALHIRDLNTLATPGSYVSLHMFAEDLTTEEQAVVVQILRTASLAD